ncbi:MAG: GAF domain-containing protein [Desulfosarcina sp.]|nr:GAF domain-containing protein [Desulfosarcina sp.]
MSASVLSSWDINQLLPVDALGVSLNGTAGDHHRFTINMQEKEMQAIENQLPDVTIEEPGQHPAPALLTSTNDENMIVARPIDHELFPAANGFALPLTHQGSTFGTFFLLTDTGQNEPIEVFSDKTLWAWFSDVLSSLFYNTWNHHQHIEKEQFFNLYETISSSLCYAGDLQELLTAIISIIVAEISSEEGSIMLYNDETNELEFFSAIGETGEGLIQCHFPADQGIAGKTLQDGTPIVVNDVTKCPYFYNKISDSTNNFPYQSILAAPIILGEEKVGVIEAINKIGKDGFDEKDKRMMVAISDEVGLAVKNARMFEYVVDSYCKIRRGEMSCKGCVRPLRSWTPCAKQLGLLM